MSYSIRGNTCNCSSSAITSNAKYISPLSRVYHDKVTDMWLYPRRTGFNYPYQHTFGPNILKSWKVESDKKSPERKILFESKKGKTLSTSSNVGSVTNKCPTC
uniref:Uncharacterized protein n=1 Tax=viral metagenome TaxID=1070528 RepID=A0A6C0LXZ5_9ZZZZ